MWTILPGIRVPAPTCNQVTGVRYPDFSRLVDGTMISTPSGSLSTLYGSRSPGFNMMEFALVLSGNSAHLDYHYPQRLLDWITCQTTVA